MSRALARTRETGDEQRRTSCCTQLLCVSSCRLVRQCCHQYCKRRRWQQQVSCTDGWRAQQEPPLLACLRIHGLGIH
jgi:hypothetical protein